VRGKVGAERADLPNGPPPPLRPFGEGAPQIAGSAAKRRRICFCTRLSVPLPRAADTGPIEHSNTRRLAISRPEGWTNRRRTPMNHPQNDTQQVDSGLRDELIRLARPNGIRRIAASVRSAREVGELYALLSDPDEQIAYRAAWTLCHLDAARQADLHDFYDELAAMAVDCPHAGRRRLLLAVLCRQPQPERWSVELLDFCIEKMTDPAEPHGVRMYCMRLAYEMCRTDGDLLHEFRTLLEIIEPQALPPSLCAARRNLLAALERNRPLPRR